ncbi:MAG: nucleotidyltransferase domain-containing protein [Candidatus Njordarchaeia archaeon]
MFKINLDEVLKCLKAYAIRILDRGAIAVFLVGSLAKGNFTAFSDADVLIIVRRSNKKFFDRISEFLDPSLPVDIDPKVYTIDELLNMARHKRKIIDELIKYGKLLAGDGALIEKIKESRTSNK